MSPATIRKPRWERRQERREARKAPGKAEPRRPKEAVVARST